MFIIASFLTVRLLFTETCYTRILLLFGPIPWGHSGPLCHALSLLSSSSWTSMRRRRATVATPGEWQCKLGRAAARSGEWAQHFSNTSCCIYLPDSDKQFRKSVNI